MNFTTRLLTSCLLQSFVLLANANDRKPTIEKQPAWITITQVDYTKTSLDADAEDGYSQLNYEMQVSLEQQASYYKKAIHILSEAGVQNRSQVSVDFDPSYQSLAFHSIKIIRGNETIDQLKLANIKTVQQEKELNKFIYNGALTAVLILDDIRKDDIIEYSYTIKGFNPIFNNRYAEVFLTQYSIPVYQMFYKLIVPKTRTVNIKNSLATLQPKVETGPMATNYEWKITDAAPVHIDDNIPSWYDCYPAVMVSEFGSWKEVSDWALKLFPFQASLPSNLQKKIAEIKTKYPTLTQQATAAIRFVQDDIRYMGIEMGEHSHQPHSPAQIFNQRFGDCKDKAYLLCTLLQALGIEAYPVLNNTSYKKTIASWLPSPLSFDHCTVCTKLQGKTYWLDATIAYQRGSLDSLSYPDYQTGLVLQPGNTQLTTIPLQETGKVFSKEIFTVKNSGPVQLVVVTTSSGSFADNVRYSFKSSSTNELQKDYKALYTPYFKKIEADSLRYQDYEASGLFTIKEYYTIHDFWNEESGKAKILLEPYFINSVMKEPKEEKRTMPYSLRYPSNYEEEIEVRLPEEWPIEESTINFDAPAFELHYDYSRPATNVVRLRYSYKNKADHIEPNEVADYLHKFKEADKSLAFELTDDAHYRSSTALNTYNNKGFTAAYVVLGIFALITYLYRRSRRTNNYW